MDVESAVFRLLDAAMAEYLVLGPERLLLRLDWGDELEARLSAYRTPAESGDAPLPAVPTGDMPDAIKQMIQDRHDARDAAVVAAEQAAMVVLWPPPSATPRSAPDPSGPAWRSAAGAVSSSWWSRFRRPPGGRSAGVTDPRDGAENGPGILETSLVLGLAVLLASLLVDVLRWVGRRRRGHADGRGARGALSTMTGGIE